MTGSVHYDSVFRPGLFSGKTVIVTGGGSGLGRCTAHELKSLGARLALVGRTMEKLVTQSDVPADVIAERIEGGFVVGTLTALGEDSVRLTSLSPRTRETLPRYKLRGVYRIVGVQRLGS